MRGLSLIRSIRRGMNCSATCWSRKMSGWYSLSLANTQQIASRTLGLESLYICNSWINACAITSKNFCFSGPSTIDPKAMSPAYRGPQLLDAYMLAATNLIARSIISFPISLARACKQFPAAMLGPIASVSSSSSVSGRMSKPWSTSSISSSLH